MNLRAVKTGSQFMAIRIEKMKENPKTKTRRVSSLQNKNSRNFLHGGSQFRTKRGLAGAKVSAQRGEPSPGRRKRRSQLIHNKTKKTNKK